MKKLLSLFICAVLLLGTTLPASAQSSDSGEIDFGDISRFQLGDINCDSAVNATDMAQVKQVLMAALDCTREELADLNYDGKVNIIDLVRFKKKLSGVTVSHFDKKADELKNSIINSADSDVTGRSGKTIYVSANGTSGFSGDSATNPCSWENFLKWNGATEGSAASLTTVLFKRGDTFRGEFLAKDGYYYGAYGEGEKPKLYGSRSDYSKTEWTLENGLYTATFGYDVGNVFINDGKITGFKKSSLEEVTDVYDFYCAAVTENETTVYKLYLKLVMAPDEYENIEIGINRNIVHITQDVSNVTIENIRFMYGGAHGIRAYGNNSNIIIKNCEISHVGGAYIGNTNTTRYGNGVEFYQGCDNVSVENCYIHDIYDSGITHQGSGSYTAKNISFKGNLIENCGMGSIEYWLSYGSEDYNYAENVTYADNILRFAGFGFGGEQRSDKNMSAHIQSNGMNNNNFTNFTISNNIFDQSTYELVNIISENGTYPILSGNIYAQSTGCLLGTYMNNQNLVFDVFADNYVNGIFGDKEAEIFYY